MTVRDEATALRNQLGVAAPEANDRSKGGTPRLLAAGGILAALGAASMKNMAVKPTGNADTDFVLMMMPHHQGAIDMAKVELQYGKDTELRQLATDIVEAQEKEITEMKAWLAKNVK
jgi:uncharacterized protein (DUF305 family)